MLMCLQQEAVDEEGERNAGVDGQLVDDDHLHVVRIAHHVGADEDVDHRQDEGIDQVGEEQDPHVVRIGEEVPVFVEELFHAAASNGEVWRISWIERRAPQMTLSEAP